MYNQSGIILLFQATWKWFAARPWSRYFAWTLTGLGLAIGCFGIYSTLEAGETVAVETSSSPVCSSPEPVSLLIVDVSGAVQNPGVYTLPQQSTVSDAVTQAGGFSSEVDKVKLAQEINLAQPVKHQGKVFIPFYTDQSKQDVLQPSQAIQNGNQLVVSVNTASESELQKIPGIGSKRSQDIINNRPYVELSELMTKAGLTRTLYEQIEQLVRL